MLKEVTLVKIFCYPGTLHGSVFIVARTEKQVSFENILKSC